MVPASPRPPDAPPSPDADDHPATPSRVEWAYHHGTVRWLRWVTYAVAGLLGGVLLAIGVMLLWVGVGVLLFGSWEVRALVVLLALVGGPASLLYLWPILTDPDQRPTFHGDYRVTPRLDRRRLAVAVVLGALAIGGAAAVAIEFVYAIVVAALFGGAFALACSTTGTVDAEELTLSDGLHTRSLERVRAVHRYDLGPFAVFRLEAARGPGSLSVPRLVHVPRGVAPAAERVLDRAVTADHDAGDPNRAVQVVAAGLGVVFLAAGVVSVAFAPALGGYGALVLWLFAVLLFAVAVVEG